MERRGQRARIPALALGALLAVALLGPGAATAASAALPRGVMLRSVVDPAAHSRLPSYRVSRSFLGLSAEYDKVLALTGYPYFGYDQPFIVLMRDLGAYGGGTPSLRIGGYTEDYAWWDPSRQPGYKRRLYYPITPGVVSSLQGLESQLPMPLTLGLNFGNKDNRYAIGWAKEATAAFGHRSLFEFGNEPDLYGDSFPFRYKGRLHHSIPLRSKWSYAAYLKQWQRRATAIKRAVRGIRLAGPSTVRTTWTQATPYFLRHERSLVNAVTLHMYPLCVCVRNRALAAYPSVPHLLSFGSIFGPLRIFAPIIRAAHRRHIPFRLSETGPIAGGGGKLGPTFATSLWALNWMFSLAEIGASGLNFHTAGTYSPVIPRYHGQLGNGGHWLVYPQPIYYAMLLFARATGHGARFLPDPSFLTSTARPGANTSLWASVDHAHVVHVVLVDGSLHGTGKVQLRIPHAIGAASVTRLTAPSPLASHGLRLAGQSFAYPTADGALSGRYVSQRLRRDRSGYFTVKMPAVSAAMLTVRTR